MLSDNKSCDKVKLKCLLKKPTFSDCSKKKEENLIKKIVLPKTCNNYLLTSTIFSILE